jgi:hypothetical protein
LANATEDLAATVLAFMLGLAISLALSLVGSYGF